MEFHTICRREVPREPLTLVLRSFGAEVAWDGEGSRHNENSEEITHQVTFAAAGGSCPSICFEVGVT